MCSWMYFCFILEKTMVVPEEEQEEEREEEEEAQEEEIRSGLSHKRYVLHYWKHVSHILVIIHLLFTDGWRMEDGEDDNREWEPEEETVCGKNMSIKTKCTCTIKHV